MVANIKQKNSLYKKSMFILVKIIPFTEITSDSDTEFSVEIDLTELGVDVQTEPRYINVAHIESIEPQENGCMICMDCNLEYRVTESAEIIMSKIREAQRNYILS
jgi:uncharacterized protein YlzI (FlbEa/FlbD family)